MRSRGSVGVVGLLVLVASFGGLVACGSNASSPAGATSSSGAGGARTSATSSGSTGTGGAITSSSSSSSAGTGGASSSSGGGGSGPKSPLAGLVDMQDVSWHNTATGVPDFVMTNVNMFPGVLGGIVINATWSALEATEGTYDFSAIDGALAQIQTYNAANPSNPLGAKLRLYGVSNAPDWAKNLNGGPIMILRNAVGPCTTTPCPLTIGLYWESTYNAKWRAAQAALAARYDGNPLIRHVTVTSCAQQTDEPFVPTSDPGSRAALLAKGYTDAIQQACLLGAIEDYAAWTTTIVDYTINPFTPYEADGGGAESTFPVSVMQACRTKLGARCVLGNHALSAPLYASDSDIYTAIGKMGAPVSFQTDAPVPMGCRRTQTVAQGVALSASSIEIWPGTKQQGFDTLTLADMQQLASEFPTPIPVGNPTSTSLCPGFH